MRSTHRVLIGSMFAGAVLGLLAGAALFVVLGAAAALVPGSWHPGPRLARLLTVLCWVALPLGGAVLGLLEGRLKLR